jgi:hypothetical protein
MNTMPLSAVKSMIKVHNNLQSMLRPKRDVSYPVDANLDDAAEALNLIDPWKIEYHEWVKLLAALYHSFGDAALPVAERWADGEGNEVQVKWKSFQRTPGKPATVGSIYEIAKRFGWRSRQPQA